MLFDAINKIERRLGPLLSYKPGRFELPGGVVSLTFDDFPKSALRGAEILERHQSRGTFYVSSGLVGTENHLGRMCDVDDVRTLNERGHEIGCHTYSHVDCSREKVATVLEEVSRNDAACRMVIGDGRTTNFAFPFGGSSFAARRALRDRFVSCRGIRAGINWGVGDLTDLMSIRVYHHLFDIRQMTLLLDRCKALGGWIIFYTHDVSATPSAFGCTPEELEAVVAYASGLMPVVTVREAIERLGVQAS